ncbi:MAG: helix-turn-helix domain-containing protein, partial [Gammaproteobacteria bacterium]|nr:helix-turn-helix domain-containing protein [Gammaproteobacteria bacterium]
WPGNIRELKNVIERAVILSRGKVLRLDLAMANILDDGGSGDGDGGQRSDAVAGDAATGRRILTEEELQRLARDNIVAALNATDWRVSGPNGAAKLLGLKPTTLADRIKRLGIRRARGAAA